LKQISIPTEAGFMEATLKASMKKKAAEKDKNAKEVEQVEEVVEDLTGELVSIIILLPVTPYMK
jgi:hypothetical protein